MEMFYTLVVLLIIGGVAGWLAGLFMRGGGFGIVVNIIVGIIGAVIGRWLVGGYMPEIYAIGAISLGAIIAAFIGAVVLLFIIGLIKK